MQAPTNSWLKGIFGYGKIATDVPFLLTSLTLFGIWKFNRRGGNRNTLMGSARFGDRRDLAKLESSGDLIIGRSGRNNRLLRYDGPAHLLTMAPTRSGKGVGTIMEIELGIARLERRDARQAGVLRLWLHDMVMLAFAGRILSVDAAIALRCARLHVPDTKNERDVWIAATGLVHDLTVVTRNLADFASTGVPLLDPWTTPSEEQQ